MTPSEPRRLRTDAQRNRTALLEAARRAFAQHGVETSLEDLARQVGLGKGTLYRHFATREDLVAAVLREEIEGLDDRAAALGSAPDPEAALAEWLRALAAFSATYTGLPGRLLNAAAAGHGSFTDVCDRLEAHTAHLLERTRTAEAVGKPVNAEDLYILVNAIAWANARSGSGDRLSDYVDVLLRGIGLRGV